jgi:hypothetical protein
VPLDWLAPSGQTYAYMAASHDLVSGQIRAVTVADGSSGNVTLDGGWELLSTLDTGVYAVRLNTPGAWYVPFGYPPAEIVDHGSWLKYYSGALWGIDSSRKVIQHQLSGGVETSWGTVSSVSALVGFGASGEPLVATGGKLVMLHLEGSATILWPGTGGLGEGGRAVADGLGVWFEVDGSRVGEPGAGIYLWTPDKGARLIASETVHVMGGCG